MFDSALSAKRDVTLYTSLPPVLRRKIGCRDVSDIYQRACINSWQKLGFDVASLNSAVEIEILSKAGLGVTFIEVPSGPPRIEEIFEAIRASGKEVAGIINADCLLAANEGVAAALLGAAAEGLVMTERMNMRDSDGEITDFSCSGFDFFCFATQPLHGMRYDPEITLGTPWWDYWFPLSYRQAGGSLFHMKTPVLIHLDHYQNWSDEIYFAVGRKFYAAFDFETPGSAPCPALALGPAEELTNDQIGLVAPTFFNWLKRAAAPVSVDDASGALLLAFLAGISRVPIKLAKQDAELQDIRQRPLRHKLRNIWAGAFAAARAF